jgi:copper homeostasis protein (lipoprotein)
MSCSILFKRKLGDLPATYSGVFPCASCPGIHYTLNLFPDRVFFLRTTYLEEDRSFYDVGKWTADRKNLFLHGSRKIAMKFAINKRGELRLLDVTGRPPASGLDYALVRTREFEALEPRLRVRGMYSYFADAGVFKECISGKRLAVAQEGDNAALESAYIKSRKQQREPLLAYVEGRIVKREGQADALVVERFIDLWRAQSCG